MVLVAVLGISVSCIGYQMDRNQAIIAAAGVGAIVAITNLAGKILEGDFGAEVDDDGNSTTAKTWEEFLGRIRPNIILAMVMIAGLGWGISILGSRWDDVPGVIGNEAIVSAAGVGAIIAIANLAGNILEKEFRPNQATTGFFAKVRPNILVSMALIGGLGFGISMLGLAMKEEVLVAAGGVGAIVAVTNLAGKILEKDE